MLSSLNSAWMDHASSSYDQDTLDSLDHIDYDCIMDMWQDHQVSCRNRIVHDGMECNIRQELESQDTSLSSDSSDSCREEIDSVDAESAIMDSDSIMNSDSDDSSVIILGETRARDQDSDDSSVIFLGMSTRQKINFSRFFKQLYIPNSVYEMARYQDRLHQTCQRYASENIQRSRALKIKILIEPGFKIFERAQRQNYRNLYRSKSEWYIDKKLAKAWEMLPRKEKNGFNLVARRKISKPRRKFRYKS